MRRADSMRMTASIAAWVSEAVTTTDQTTVDRPEQCGSRPACRLPAAGGYPERSGAGPARAVIGVVLDPRAPAPPGRLLILGEQAGGGQGEPRRAGHGPYTWRIVDSPLPAMLRNRFVHSIASSLSRTSISAHPPISSLASVKGPSITVNFPSTFVTLVASSTGASPPVASRTPALVASSMKLPISAYISGFGGGIGVDGSPSVYPRNRIVVVPSVGGRCPRGTGAFRSGGPYRHPAFCPCVEHPGSRSTWSQKIFLRIERRSVTSLSSDLNRTPAPPSSAARGLNEGTTVGSRAARHRPVQRGLRRTPDCPSAVGAAAADSQGGRLSARPCRRWFL